MRRAFAFAVATPLLFAAAAFASCGGDVVPVYPGDEGNPAGVDAGVVLQPDGAIPGVSRNGWTWSNVGPQAADLFGAWGSAPDDVWFVGAAGTILHWDGHAFSAPDGGTDQELRGVWGAAPNDVWAVGRPGYTVGDAAILHFDGVAWSVAKTVPSSELYSVWGSGPKDVWAVGAKGLAVHYDGASWSEVQTGTTDDLDGVYTSGPGDVWAVGSAASLGFSATVLRYDGSAWAHVVPPDDRASFSKVWGTGAKDVWLVGHAQIDTAQPADDPNGYAVHWDGSGFGTPLLLSSYSTPLRALFGSSPGDVHAVGSANAIESWNGSAWSAHALPGDYEAVWESGPSDVWAVGLGGVMAHFDGAAWTQVAPPPPPRGFYAAAAICSLGPADVWVAGNGALAAQLLHYDGQKWAPSTIDATSPAYLWFYGLWGTSSSNLWGVGSGPLPNTARIVHYDGSAWSVAYDLQNDYGFMGVWGASDSDVWFSGDSGVLVHWDGTHMTNVSLGTTTDQLFAVRGTSSTDVWLAGNTNLDLTVRHYDGQKWSVAYTGSGMVTGLYAAAPNDAWAVGWEGTALHYDGTTWTDVSKSMPREVGAIWGSGASDVWAGGWFGAVLHYDGGAWSSVPLTSEDVVGVSGSGPSDAWLLTKSGAVLHHP